VPCDGKEASWEMGGGRGGTGGALPSTGCPDEQVRDKEAPSTTAPQRAASSCALQSSWLSWPPSGHPPPVRHVVLVAVLHRTEQLHEVVARLILV